MKPRRFDYIRPDSVEEAVAVLAEHGDRANVLAGGQSLMAMLNLRIAELESQIHQHAQPPARKATAERSVWIEYDGTSLHVAVADDSDIRPANLIDYPIDIPSTTGS